MLSNWRDFFRHTVYVRVRSDGFHLRHIEAQREVDFIAVRRFTHPRLLIGNFAAAQDAFAQALARLRKRGRLTPALHVLIQPLEKVEGGVADVEERILHELALGVGARKAVVWTAAGQLRDDEVLAKFSK